MKDRFGEIDSYFKSCQVHNHVMFVLNRKNFFILSNCLVYVVMVQIRVLLWFI